MNTRFNIQFKVNPLYVFLHAINMNQDEEPFKGWAKFTNAIWEKNPEIFFDRCLANVLTPPFWPEGAIK